MKDKNKRLNIDQRDLPFIKNYIPRVSRTFSLAIGFLPGSLKHSVHSAYLLCRVADTIEDSPFIEKSEKKKRLLLLKDILAVARKDSSFSENDMAMLYSNIDGNMADDHRLLLESAKLFAILRRLPAQHREIIFHWAGEMAGGMAEYSQISPAGRETVAALNDINDWDRYCYYVAGTVGEMLTALFIDHYRLGPQIVGGLEHRAVSFGLGLQKVNVIKDVPDDRNRGVCFLPYDIMKKYDLAPSSLNDPQNKSRVSEFVRELISATMPHLDDAIDYAIVFPSRYKGVKMFLTVPVLLAIKTLNLIREKPFEAMAGPPLKISRRDVAGIVAAATRYSSSDEALRKYYLKLRQIKS